MSADVRNGMGSLFLNDTVAFCYFSFGAAMVKIFRDGDRLCIQANEAENRKLTADAKKLGMTVDEFIQKELDAIVADIIARDKAKP